MIFIGFGAVVTVWIGVLLMAIIEGIASCFYNAVLGQLVAWIVAILLVIIISVINPFIGIFVMVGLFWAFILTL